ncbi:MAG: glycosyltransferase [Chloroflexota bacterium]|nr:MAG: glycosyltransferase [Chloroflexota bacterium]
MRILYLSQLIPNPPDAGPKVRIYHVLQYLAKAGHEITLVAFRRESDREEDTAALSHYCSSVHTVMMHRSRSQDVKHLAKSLLTRQPFLISRDSVAAMHRRVRELLARQSFDAIHADQLWMAQYALAASAVNGANGRPKLVLDQHNAVHLIPDRLASGTSNPVKRALLQLESGRLARYELEVCRQFDCVIWVTQEDRAALARLENGRGQIAGQPVIPICVDPAAKPPVCRLETARRITFLGGMHWPPNAEGVTWFAKGVWPRVNEQVPDAVLTVIGKNPPSSLSGRDLRDANVEAPGYVADLESYLAETAVFIVPLQAGGGMRVKIVDAWSWGLPVVSTTIGAEGLSYVDGGNLFLADDPDAFARAVISLLNEPELSEQLAAAGRVAVEAQYDWRKEYRAWDEVYPSPC